MTQWVIDHVEWNRFLELRQRLFKALKECLEVDEYCKPYEGGFDVEYSLPNYFDEGERNPVWRIHLSCYLVGPSRGTDWHGETFGDALFKMEQDVNQWLKDHDAWLEKIKNDPGWVL